MCQENPCEKIIEIYLEKRQEFMKKEWLTPKSFFKRSKGDTIEFTRLRKKDIEIQKDFKRWLRSYISEHTLDMKYLKEYLAYLESHCNKLKLRISALVIILSTFVISLNYIASLEFPQYNEWIVYSIFFIFSMLAISEQLKIKDYESSYKDIINILTNILNEKEGA